MNDYKNFIVSDLSNRNSRFTFILEAPYKAELHTKIPASGDSGSVISSLLLNKRTPFGILLSKNCPTVREYSLMNASCIPIELDCYSQHPELEKEIRVISESRIPTTNKFLTNKIKVKRAFTQTAIGRRITTNFYKRLQAHIQFSDSRKFIVCGVTAQVIFEIVTGHEGYFHRNTDCDFNNEQISFFYENHPSNKSGIGKSKWYEKDHINCLISFLKL